MVPLDVGWSTAANDDDAESFNDGGDIGGGS